MDDHYHRLRMIGSTYFPDVYGDSLDMFRFFDGDPQRTRHFMDLGLLPWWTYLEMKAAFWRPLAALTHWLDYQLWPDYAGLMHAHSVLWFGGLVAVMTLVYRRLMGATWIAGFAALLYALDDAHGMPVGFLANRNVLPSCLFGGLALLAHIRWRQDAWRWGALLGPLLLAVSLLFKEAGLAITAYLFAFEVVLGQGRWRSRFAALLPYVLVVIVWRIAWNLQDYGVWGMGPYVDPLTEPLRFLGAMVFRAPVALLAQWALPPAETTIMLESLGRQVLWLVAVGFLVVLGLVLLPLLRRDRVARFWTVGMLLSVIPICAVFPGDRVLFFVGIGAMGMLAQFLAFEFGADEGRATVAGWRRPARLLAILFILVHLVLAPVLLPLRARYPMGPPSFVRQLHVNTPLDRSVEQQDLVIVNPPSPFHAISLPVRHELSGQPVPRHLRILAPGYSAMTIRRSDAYTLSIRPDLGYLSWMFDQLFRGPQVPMAEGQLVELTGMTVEITAMTPDNRPAEATFRFTVPLEDASLRWLYWKDGEFVPFAVPAIGAMVELPISLP